MRYPLDGNPIVTTHFKSRPDPGVFGVHLGIDRRAPIGTPVYAPGSGVVKSVSSGASGGKQIEVLIGSYLWRFLHLSEQSVKAGQNVVEGQVIGKTGNTGHVSGPHLHYDARKAGTSWNASLSNYVDPDSIVSSPQVIYETVKNGQTWNVRNAPVNGAIVGVVKKGESYQTERLSDGWRRILFNGKVGYVGPAAWR